MYSTSQDNFINDDLLVQKNNLKETILHEDFRHTSRLQDSARLTILCVHLFYYTMVLETWGLSIKIFLYLTLFSFYLNMNYFIMALLNSFLNYRYNMIIMKQVNINTVFRLGFTVSTVVIILYWGIYLHDPTLLGDGSLPLHFDLFLHGGNLLVLIIDKTLIDPQHGYEEKINFKVLLVIAVGYFVLVYLTFLVTGIAIYPLFAKLNPPQLLVLLGAGYSLFLTGDLIYKLLI